MSDDDPLLPVPSGTSSLNVSNPAASGDEERLRLEAYRARDPAWTQSIQPREFFAREASLSSALPVNSLASAPAWRWPINGLILAATIAFIWAYDWKLGQWFFPVSVTQRLVLMPEPAPRPPGRVSTLTRARVDALNTALERRDWEQAARLATALAADTVSAAELQKETAAWSWLGEVAVAANVCAADLLDGEVRRARFGDAVKAYDALVASGLTPGLLADYGHIIARFHLQGGAVVPEQALTSLGLERATDLLNAIGGLRARFGPEVMNSAPMRQRVLLVEGWTLARRLCEASKSPVTARFDRRNPDSARRWQRLADLLAEGRVALGSERDFLRLELFFWETAESFCFNPFSAEETVNVGGWSASEPEIEGRISRMRTRLGLER